MDASMINKIQKASEYASQPERATFISLIVEFNGANSSHRVSLDKEGWSCSCSGYSHYQICPHIMALEILFKPLLKRQPVPYAPGQNIVSDVEKAHRYSQERDRIRIARFECRFEGYNKDHRVTYDQGAWTSTASFFAQRGVCSHTMALEKILKGFVEPVRAMPVA